MANPQAENGHIDISNEIAEALMKINISSYEQRVLWFILRKTYGWHKKIDKLSLSQFSEATGLDRRLVHRALKSLSSKEMIVVICRDDKKAISYGFQKNYEKWKKPIYKKAVICRDDAVSSVEMTRVSSVEIPTKETITKETITKEKERSSCPRIFSDMDIKLTQLLIDLMQKNNPESSILRRLTEKRQQDWINQCRLLREADKRTVEQIETVIRFSQNDSFWKGNILSMLKLREQWDQLWLKAKRGDNLSGIKEWLDDKEIEDAKR